MSECGDSISSHFKVVNRHQGLEMKESTTEQVSHLRQDLCKNGDEYTSRCHVDIILLAASSVIPHIDKLKMTPMADPDGELYRSASSKFG